MDEHSLIVTTLLSGVLKGGIYSLVALGVVIIFKSSKIVSFAQGGFVCIAGIFGWLLVEVAGLPLWLGIVLALIAVMIVGFAVDRYTLRPIVGQPIISSIMVTIALFWFFNSFAVLFVAGFPRPFPMFLGSGMVHLLGGAELPVSGLWSFAIAMALYVCFILFYKYSALGLSMRGIAEDHEVVQSFGVKVKWILSQTWMIAALTSGLSGIVLGSVIGVHQGLIEMGWKGLVVAIIGGLESVPGALIMGPVLGVLEVLAVHYLDPYVGGGMEPIAPFFLLVLILVFKPYGLFGLKRIERI